MRGSWVGALCSWCHCLLESGGTLPLQGDAAQPPLQTPRMTAASRQLPGNQHGKTKDESSQVKACALQSSGLGPFAL